MYYNKLKMIKDIITDKVFLLNTGALTISFMDIQEVLKILILISTLTYTMIRLVKEINKIKKEDKG